MICTYNVLYEKNLHTKYITVNVGIRVDFQHTRRKDLKQSAIGRVERMMHLISLDISYINYIEKDPRVPVKINNLVRFDGNESEDEEIHKNIFEFTEEDEKEMHKPQTFCLIE